MEEKVNKQLLDDLNNLPKVSAPDNFEEALWKKIYLNDEKMKFNRKNIFSLNKFIPATATLAAIVIIYLLITKNSSDYEDPFLIEPPVRTDIITVSNEDTGVTDMIERKQKKEEQKWKSNQPAERDEEQNLSSNETDTSLNDKTELVAGKSQPSAVMNDQVEYVIDKEELNFLKRTITEQEKREIIELKKKIKASEFPKSE